MIAKERHVPVALLDQRVVAAGIEECIDARPAGDLVVAQTAVQHVVERRPDQAVVAGPAHERDGQQVVRDTVGFEGVVAADARQRIVRIGVDGEAVEIGRAVAALRVQDVVREHVVRSDPPRGRDRAHRALDRELVVGGGIAVEVDPVGLEVVFRQAVGVRLRHLDLRRFRDHEAAADGRGERRGRHRAHDHQAGSALRRLVIGMAVDTLREAGGDRLERVPGDDRVAERRGIDDD